MYYKLVDGVPAEPPETYAGDDKTIFGYRALIGRDAAFRRQEGYYPLEGTPPEYNQHAQRLDASYEQREDCIEAEYTVTELSAVEKAANYKALTVQYIREQYDVNAEFDVLNAGISNPTDAEYLVYRGYVEDCKTRAHIDVYGGVLG